MTAEEWATLLALSLLWGGSFFFNGILVHALPVLTIVAGRVTLAAVTLWLVVRALGIAMPPANASRSFLVMGLLNNVVPFCLIVWGQHTLASGLAAILNATTPLFAVIVTHLFTRDERATPGKICGVVLGFAGVTVLIGPDIAAGLGTNMARQAAVLGAAVSYAFAGLYGRRFRQMGLDPVATATGQVTASAVLLLPIALLFERPFAATPPSVEAIAALVGLAVLSTALAYALFFRLLASAGATNVLLVTFLVPVSAVALGVLVLGEAVAPRQLAGMVLIGTGLAAIDGRLIALTRRNKLT